MALSEFDAQEFIFECTASILLVTIIFTGFKLMGAIDWSWWWVLSPIWIPIALFVALIVLSFLFE